MKKSNNTSRRYRSSLKWGAKAVIVFSLLLAGTGCHEDKDTRTEVKQPTTTEVTSCLSTTISTSTTSTNTSTSTSVTTTTTTAQTTLMIQPVTESQTIAVVTEAYVAPVTEYVEPVYNNNGYSNSDTILLAQLINKEASASYDGKLAVASVVVNRSNYYGQSISDVIYAPGQFTTCYSLGYYTDADYQAAQQILTNGSVNNAFYFDGCHPDCLNHFRDINNNFVGAW